MDDFRRLDDRLHNAFDIAKERVVSDEPYTDNPDEWRRRANEWMTGTSDGRQVLERLDDLAGYIDDDLAEVSSGMQSLISANDADILIGSHVMDSETRTALQAAGSKLASSLGEVDHLLGQAISRRHTLENDLMAEGVLRRTAWMMSDPPRESTPPAISHSNLMLSLVHDMRPRLEKVEGAGNLGQQWSNLSKLDDRIHDRIVRLAGDLAKDVDAIQSQYFCIRRSDAITGAYVREARRCANVLMHDTDRSVEEAHPARRDVKGQAFGSASILDFKDQVSMVQDDVRHMEGVLLDAHRWMDDRFGDTVY